MVLATAVVRGDPIAAASAAQVRDRATRAAVERDLGCACLCKRKVVATVVALMERAQLRAGNDESARANGSYGATALRDRRRRA